MKRTMLRQSVIVFGLSAWLYSGSCIDISQVVNGSTQNKQGPTVQLPRVENPNEGVIDSASFVVTVPAEGEFYVAGQRLTPEVLAETIRDELTDKPAGHQMVYIRSGSPLKFRAIRQVLDIVRELGFARIALIVERAESRREAVFEASIFMRPDGKVDPSDIKAPPPRRQTSRNPAPPPPPPPPPPPTRMPPGEVPREIPRLPDALVVEIKIEAGSSDPVIALNRAALSLPELRSTLASLLEIRSDHPICVKPAREVAYVDVIAVLDEIRGAGTDVLWLIIDEVEVPLGIARFAAHQPVDARNEVGVPGGVPGGEPGPPRIIRKSGGVLKGSAIRRVDATTPPLARAAKVSGPVVVEVVVDEEGDVISARALSGHPLLKDAAVEAARGWKFTRTELSGVPIKVIGTLTFVFKE